MTYPKALLSFHIRKSCYIYRYEIYERKKNVVDQSWITQKKTEAILSMFGDGGMHDLILFHLVNFLRNIEFLI